MLLLHSTPCRCLHRTCRIWSKIPRRGREPSDPQRPQQLTLFLRVQVEHILELDGCLPTPSASGIHEISFSESVGRCVFAMCPILLLRQTSRAHPNGCISGNGQARTILESPNSDLSAATESETGQRGRVCTSVCTTQPSESTLLTEPSMTTSSRTLLPSSQAGAKLLQHHHFARRSLRCWRAKFRQALSNCPKISPWSGRLLRSKPSQLLGWLVTMPENSCCHLLLLKKTNIYF